MKKCTGENCPMQIGYDVEKCAAIEKCPYRTWPVTIAISTCAPAWGATYPFPQFGHCAANFYSRPRVGGDPEFDSIVVELREFLLTPPYGGRHHFVIKGCVGVGISTHAPE